MRLFSKVPDGGKDSGVTAYFLIECKSLFSIGLLRFSEGSREAYHTHAFNALTWWLYGAVVEEHYEGGPIAESNICKYFSPSFKPKYTPRTCFHKINATRTTWALTFRGPWAKHWYEYKDGKVIKLTHGRVEV